ncbi:BZ3500_MvSof-1268-A1-R1_Chr7-1g09220 [Microbotryum saponariae]|uniref:mannan endo-1,4-beta-mannosidase n=1 Tax=Microbotryum saponariae TaxID=289078 RepID=A0A2X0KWY2_9BASI|nr:BZ3501_MvSof-1269-A2-R1_Chr7-1g08925 [Microbotryum saponariae]SDA03022.1 BZ3500_MvSof-1268-A1-R1_Chr7-1g09220 [Microbotryum saponariae]
MASLSSSCLATASSPAHLLSSPSQLGVEPATSFVTRDGTRLMLDDKPWVAVGPNIYWLGQDENVQPNPAWPSQSRVLEVMAIAATMGANTIRSTTLGVSVGNSRSVEPSLGTFNETALETIDFALSTARAYGLRLIIPLTDQYDYYHGGIPTFLRWRNLSATNPKADFGPFYDTTSQVYSDFALYVTTLLSHRSSLTNLIMAEDPTVLAFETGNELGGWGGSNYPPPSKWTTSIAKLIKSLAPDTLVADGSYGVHKAGLNIAEIDIVSDHAYPPYSYNVRKAANLAHSSGKVFLLGEFDWTNRYYFPLTYLAVLIPAVLAALVFLLPARWWPWQASLGCFCCRGRRRRKRQAKASYFEVMHSDSVRLSSASVPLVEEPDPKYAFPPPSTPLGASSRALPSLDGRRSFLDRTLPIRRWHFSLLILLLAAPLGALIHTFLPTPLSSFLPAVEGLALDGKLSGSFYWSLFGKDSTCCQYVPHGDGYTLHYPSDPGVVDGSGKNVVELTKHAYRLSNNVTWWGAAISSLTLNDLPSVQCPQNASATMGTTDLKNRKPWERANVTEL